MKKGLTDDEPADESGWPPIAAVAGHFPHLPASPASLGAQLPARQSPPNNPRNRCRRPKRKRLEPGT
jgi:hypothetical protein